MAYTVNKTNSSASVSSYIVQDSILNSETDLAFVGKGYSGYGEIVAEDFLHLLENFANTSAPNKPITGQLWYDESKQRLKVYESTYNHVNNMQKEKKILLIIMTYLFLIVSLEEIIETEDMMNHKSIWIK